MSALAVKQTSNYFGECVFSEANFLRHRQEAQ
jgi:hypothetical protein